MPVALLGCLVIAAPLALTWARPLVMTVVFAYESGLISTTAPHISPP
jgi:hypothetical protein